MNNTNIHQNHFLRNVPHFYKKININLSEDDILYLQNIFLTNGYHYFATNNVKSGRNIIHRILHSLNYYNNIACLTLNDLPLEKNILDLYKFLNTNEYLNSTSKNLYDFFLDNQFYYDFLLIEVSDDLLKKIWFSKFQEYLDEFNFQNNMPIIFLKNE